jgi:imidazolonepropionase-like amidohydrolase
VVIEDRHIATVRTGESVETGPEDRVVDLEGRTVMPGMVSSHFHATYHELGSKTAPFGLEEPPALQAVRAAHHLELLLRSGFTGAVSAGAPFAIDASMKAAIAEGLIVGPRLMAGSRDVSTTGHAGDKSFPWYWDVGARGAINRSDGPDAFRLAVREEIKQGAEIIKMFVTGGHGTVAPSEQIEMTREEITAGIEAAHQRGALVRGHIANREAIHMALDAGIDVIDHGDGLDALAIERMVELGTFLVPSQLFPARFAEMMGGEEGLGFSAAMAQDIERALAVLPVANAAGVRLLCGDDYGAIGLPHGRYADELEFYVKEAGIPALDVIRWATRHGAELMGRGHELGAVREGFLADLVVVDGDPLADIALLQDPARLLAVMKGGTPAKDELATLEVAR